MSFILYRQLPVPPCSDRAAGLVTATMNEAVAVATVERLGAELDQDRTRRTHFRYF